MAKVMAKEGMSAAPRLLFGERVKRRGQGGVEPHGHCHWQLELVFAGDLDAWLRERRLEMRPGDALLIPPGVPHSFRYPEAEVEYLSLKFTAALEEGCVEGLVRRELCRDFSACAEIVSRRLPSVFTRGVGVSLALLEGLLGALLELCREAAGEAAPATVGARLRELVQRRGGRPLPVGEAGMALGLGRKRLGELVRAETGLGVKRAIDAERAEIAKNILALSEMSLGEASYNLGFPDSYTFARFFKKQVGESPGRFAKAARGA